MTGVDPYIKSVLRRRLTVAAYVRGGKWNCMLTVLDRLQRRIIYLRSE